MKTSTLTGKALDWAVNYAEGLNNIFTPVNYCGKWEHGGPLIERERICPCPSNTVAGSPWSATDLSGHITQFGPTPLIAAMRCYVASKLGDDVDVPPDLV